MSLTNFIKRYNGKLFTAFANFVCRIFVFFLSKQTIYNIIDFSRQHNINCLRSYQWSYVVFMVDRNLILFLYSHLLWFVLRKCRTVHGDPCKYKRYTPEETERERGKRKSKTINEIHCSVSTFNQSICDMMYCLL